MIRLVAAAIALLAAGETRAEQLTIALSAREVKIDSNFTGASITVFGVIERDAMSVARPGGFEVATLVLGPSETVVARRKDRILGIWANGASETIAAVPSFYAVDTSGALTLVALDPLLDRYGIGFDNIGIAYSGRPLVNDPAAKEFRDAFIRLKQESGLYAERIGGVTFVGNSVFRSTIVIPANVPTGRYTVTVYLFSGGTLLASAADAMEISKTGVEQYMSSLARNQSLVYGLACVTLALFTGWLGGVIFRRD